MAQRFRALGFRDGLGLQGSGLPVSRGRAWDLETWEVKVLGFLNPGFRV